MKTWQNIKQLIKRLKILGLYHGVVQILDLLECCTMYCGGHQKHKVWDIPTPSQDSSDHPCLREDDCQLE
jgi:hypothetical protein